ncbi:MAG TPA: HEAT repeat domain-containing protein [Candidatus Ozemobacteraceae bacterium]|nr:HEAT repeat domain-containing protein [Candidatus Ozemobacteraceae bacterium]
MTDTRFTAAPTDAAGFSECLSLLESTDLLARRRGAAQLERFHEPKALRVALALANDPDEQVRETAREVAGILRRAGVAVQVGKAIQRKVATDTLLSSSEIMDETFFLWRRNRAGICAAWAVADAPQLLLGLGIFVYSSQTHGFEPFEGTPGLILKGIILLIFLFGRPLAWMLIGKAFIGAFQDRNSQTVANRPMSAMEYLGFFQMNIITSGPLIAGIYLIFATDTGLAPLFLIFYLIFFLGYHSFSFTLMPRQLMTNADALKNTAALFREGLEGWSFRRVVYMSFLWCMTMIYSALFMSGQLSLDLLDIPFRHAIPLIMVLLCDTLMDPFWIGWEITVARLSQNRSGAAGAGS